MPFDNDALAASVDQLLENNVFAAAGFDEGYAQWKAANGGVFTVSVPQAIDFMFETARKAAPKS
jgi:hypothetical protein